jgi:FkbM family methyltransferase
LRDEARNYRDHRSFLRVKRINLCHHLGLASLLPRHRVFIHPRALRQPVVIRDRGTDLATFREVVFGDQYQTELIPWSQLRTIVDLGSNIGISVRLWQQRCPDASILAVEPDATNRELLEQNIAEGPAPHNVTVVEGCVAGQPGHVQLNRRAGAWGFFIERPADRVEQPTQAFTIDTLLDNFAPEKTIDLLKMDIEGAEAECLSQCAAWIQRVRWMFLETHQPLTWDRALAMLRAADIEYEVMFCKREAKSCHGLIRLGAG